MPLILVRIDDRLIHGQVVVGWGSFLHPNRIILCSDEVAQSDWEREIYLAAVPSEEMEVSILTTEETAKELKEGTFGDEKIILLVESPQTVVDLVQKGMEIKSVNVGGMHYMKGKRQLTPFVFVDDEDVKSFRELWKLNVELEGRDVPTSKKVNLAQCLGFC